MKIYDELTGAEMSAVDDEWGYTYQGQRQVGTEPERIETVPGTNLRRRIPARPIIEECLWYHSYTDEEQIELYKRRLAETDYVVIKIMEGAATREEYADIITQRAEWRGRINALENPPVFTLETPTIRPVGG